MSKKEFIESTKECLTDLTAAAAEEKSAVGTEKVERVTLSQEAVARLNTWVKQVEDSRPGVEISRRDLVQWLIMVRTDALDPAEVRSLAESHYNELRFLQYAIRQLKSARAQGQPLTLQDFVKELPSIKQTEGLQKRGRRKRVAAEIKNDTPAAIADDSMETPPGNAHF